MTRKLTDYMGLRAAETILPLVVDINGDTMQGPLHVLDPMSDDEPATSKQLQDEISRSTDADADLQADVDALTLALNGVFPIPFQFPDPIQPGRYDILIDNPSAFTLLKGTTNARRMSAECGYEVNGVPVPGLANVVATPVNNPKVPSDPAGILVPTGAKLTAVVRKIQSGADRVRIDGAARSGTGGNLAPTVRTDLVYDVDAGALLSADLASALASAGFAFARASEWWNEDLVQTAASGVVGLDPVRGLFLDGTATNLFLNSFAPVGQSISLPAGSYVVTMLGEGSVFLTNAVTATVTKNAKSTFTLASTTTLNVALSGDVKYVFVGLGEAKTSPVKTLGASATRAAASLVATRAAGALSASTILLKARAPYSHVSGATLVQFDDNSDANRIQVRRLSNGTVQVQQVVGGTITPIMSLSGIAPDDGEFALGVSWTAGAWVARGRATGASTIVGATSAVAIPSGMVRERFGAMNSGAQPLDRSILRLARSASAWSAADIDAWLNVN